MLMKSIDYDKAINQFNNDIDNPIIYCVIGDREALQKLAEDCPDLTIQFYENASEVPVGNIVTILSYGTFWIVSPPSGEAYKVLLEKVKPCVEFPISFKHLGLLCLCFGGLLLLKGIKRCRR